MRKLWQQDILRYLTNRHQKKGADDPGLPFGLHLQLKIVRAELHLGSDNARLSSFINRKKNSPYTVGFDAAEAFDKLIQPELDAGRLTPEVALRNFHEFLWVEGIEDTWKDIPDYRECIIAAFTEGFPRHHAIEVDSIPTLHGERFPANTFFTGREADLAQMDGIFSQEDVLVLSGVGGIGKTSLAEEYARRHADRYSARQLIALEPGFTSYAELLMAVQFDGLGNEAAADREQLLEERIKYLCSLDSSTLLVFDNIDRDLEDYRLFRQLLRDSGAHIIVTTRLQEAFPEGIEMAVSTLSPEDQLGLLEKSMGRPFREREERAAQEICRRLDGHTFVIQLLGRAIRKQEISCTQMLEKIQGLTGFAALDEEVRVQKDDFNRSTQILRYIREILFSLEPLNAYQQDLLRFLTLLPFEGVARTLLTDILALDAAVLSDLADRSWIQHDTDRDVIRLHSVIREAILAELPVNSHTCTPFLCELDRSLWEPEMSPEFADLLRLAGNAIDMLYITDDLRSFLTSDRLKPLYDRLFKGTQSKNVWEKWREELEISSKDEELLPETAKTLEMYAAFCEYMAVLERARTAMDAASFRMPFLDTQEALAAVEQNNDSDLFSEAAIRFLDLFSELYYTDENGNPENTGDMDPELFLQLATSTVGAQLTDYLQEAGLTVGMDSDAAAVPAPASVLSREDMQLLTAVSEPAYNSFLITALEAFSASQALLPFVASTAVYALALLFTLQRLAVSGLQSLEDITLQTGWRFPLVTSLPEGFSLAEDGLEYEEELWGRPVLTMLFERGSDSLLVRISRPNRKWEMDEFDLQSPEVIEETAGRRIRAGSSENALGPDIQVDIGPWCIRIQGVEGAISREEALQAARGIQLPAEETMTAAVS